MRPSRLLLTLVMLCGLRAFSQDPPEIAMGINPQSTYHSGDFDSVDMATGRLNLRIPLVVDHSQRGKLNFTYSVSYTSTGTWIYVITGVNPQHFQIEPPKYGVSSPGIVTGGLPYSISTVRYKDSGTGYTDTASFLVEEGYGLGPLHPLGSISGGVMEAIDGSGFRSSSLRLLNRQGILTSTLEDTNGNEWTGGGTYPTYTNTDTLGRTWTTTQNSTDVSGCPAGGPVAASSSTIWTTPGPQSGLRTFKFCYSIYPILTNFTSGGSPYSQYQVTPGVTLLTGVVLPDGTTWRFDYDYNSYGDLIAVHTPTGGSISYNWTTTSGGCGSTDVVDLPPVSADVMIRTPGHAANWR